MEDKEERRYNVRVKIVVAVLVSSILTFCLTVMIYGHYLSKNGLIVNSYESSGEISDDLDLIKTYIDMNYKGEINDDNLKFGALKGYVDGLGDEYTELMDTREWGNMSTMLTKTVGIGAYMIEPSDSDYVMIAGTVEDSPAEKAGLLLGDKIKEVNLEDVTGKGSEYVSNKIKNGDEGSWVKIKVLRDKEEIVFDIQRAKINYYKIKHEMIENNIGYIDFSSFTDTSYEEFKEAYEDLKNNGAKSLIIDLRSNTGGDVSQVLKIADMFVDSGKTIITVEDKDGNRVDSKSTDEKVIDIPVVVLVNDYTASSSEILVGMLKDYGLAKIVGIKTFGKGVIQNVYQDVLGKKSGITLKITVAEYFTPNGNKVQKKGIEPDVVVNGTAIEMQGVSRENDEQFKKAVELLK